MPLAEVREEQTETIQQRFRSLQTTRDVASLLDVFTWSPCVQDPNNPTDKEVLRVENYDVVENALYKFLETVLI